jgi:CheY-like chemotaxis protein
MDRSWDPARSGPGRRILVVEDDPHMREALCALLALWGHDVANAAEGQMGVSVASRFSPEIIFLDLGLPDIHGYEVASRLRAMPASSWPFLVALSGYGTAQDYARTRANGFDAHLLKPFTPEKLRQLLAAVPLERTGPADVRPKAVGQ